MKTLKTIATVLATIVVSTGGVAAQQWGGVAGIVASQGYSASSGLSMTVRPHEDPPIEATDADRTQAAPLPRARHRRNIRTELAGDIQHGRHAHVARSSVPRASLLAKAKRPGIRRRARLA